VKVVAAGVAVASVASDAVVRRRPPESSTVATRRRPRQRRTMNYIPVATMTSCGRCTRRTDHRIRRNSRRRRPCRSNKVPRSIHRRPWPSGARDGDGDVGTRRQRPVRTLRDCCRSGSRRRRMRWRWRRLRRTGAAAAVGIRRRQTGPW